MEPIICNNILYNKASHATVECNCTYRMKNNSKQNCIVLLALKHIAFIRF